MILWWTLPEMDDIKNTEKEESWQAHTFGEAPFIPFLSFFFLSREPLSTTISITFTRKAPLLFIEAGCVSYWSNHYWPQWENDFAIVEGQQWFLGALKSAKGKEKLSVSLLSAELLSSGGMPLWKRISLKVWERALDKDSIWHVLEMFT